MSRKEIPRLERDEARKLALYWTKYFSCAENMFTRNDLLYFHIYIFDLLSVEQLKRIRDTGVWINEIEDLPQIQAILVKCKIYLQS